jgi:hypothetical protein
VWLTHVLPSASVKCQPDRNKKQGFYGSGHQGTSTVSKLAAPSLTVERCESK